MAGPTAAAIERHPHLALPCRPGWVRVDLHSHTMWSGDSTTTPDEVADAVVDAGIDVLCVTDHQAVAGARRLAAEFLAADMKCRVVVGEELRTRAGELIGLFLTDRVPAGTPPVVAARQIREQGGVVYVPHPFDPLRHRLTDSAIDGLCAERLIDAIEVFNAKTSLPSLNRRAAAFAEQHGLPGGAGSDAHVPLAIGAAFVEMPDFDGPVEFLERLHEGRVCGHHWDQPRPWSARVVPGTTAL